MRGKSFKVSFQILFATGIAASALISMSISPTQSEAFGTFSTFWNCKIRNASISSSQPLVVATQDAYAGSTPALGGSTASGTPASITGSPLTPTAAGANSGTGATYSGTGGGSGAGLTTADGRATFTATITVSHSGANACTTQAPFGAVSCSVPTFTITDTQLKNGGSAGLQVDAYWQKTTCNKLTNTIPKKEFVVKQVSNIRGATTSDNIGTLWEAVVNGSYLYFTANNSNGVKKLFRTDGTTVTQVTNLRNNQSASDAIGKPTVWGGAVYFYGEASAGVVKLYKYDGTNVIQISDIRGAGVSDGVIDVSVCGTKLCFVADEATSTADKLYAYDGTNIQQITDLQGAGVSDDFGGNKYASTNAWYFISAINATRKFYSYDGTTLKQLTNTRGAGVSDTFYNSTWNIRVVEFGSDIMVWAYSASNGTMKLHKIDSSGNVVKISNLKNNQGAHDRDTSVAGGPYGMDTFNGKFIFPAWNTNDVYKLFQWDGTNFTQISNTRNDQTLTDNPRLSESGAMLSGKYCFVGDNSNGAGKLFCYDGTSVTQVSNTRNDNTASDGIGNFMYYNNKLVFGAEIAAGVKKLFVYDGTNVMRVSNTSGSDSATDWVILDRSLVINNKFLFPAYNANGVQKLYALCDYADGCTP